MTKNMLPLSNSSYLGKNHLPAFCSKRNKLGFYFFLLYIKYFKKIKNFIWPKTLSGKEIHLFFLDGCFSVLMFCPLGVSKRDLSICVSALAHRWQDWEIHNQRTDKSVWFISLLKPHLTLPRNVGYGILV